MKKYRQQLSISVVALIFGACISAQADTTLLSDTFTLNGTSRVANGILNGTSAEYSSLNGPEVWNTGSAQLDGVPYFTSDGQVALKGKSEQGQPYTFTELPFAPSDVPGDTVLKLEADISSQTFAGMNTSLNYTDFGFGENSSDFAPNFGVQIYNSRAQLIDDSNPGYHSASIPFYASTVTSEHFAVTVDLTAMTIAVSDNGKDLFGAVSLIGSTPNGYSVQSVTGVGTFTSAPVAPWYMDNFKLSSVQAAPEPSMLILPALGFLGILKRKPKA